MPRLVTIATFQLPHQSYILKSKLESEGITVELRDELTVQADNFLSNAIGGVKLQVYEQDMEKALDIMKEGGYPAPSEAQDTSPKNIIKQIVVPFVIIMVVLVVWIIMRSV